MIVVAGCASSTSPAPTTPPVTTGASAVAAPTTAARPDLSGLVGTWGGHGRSLVVEANGSGSAAWRTYQECQPGGTAACDVTTPTGISFGYRLAFTLTARHGQTASGRVTSDNMGVAPGSTFEVAIVANNQIAISDSSPPTGQPHDFCGSAAPPGACGY